MLDNLLTHITLPGKLKLSDGSILSEDITFHVVGGLTPYYASVDQVRLMGGIYLTKLADMTIAFMIYQQSKQSELITYTAPAPPVDPTNPSWPWKLFNGARNQWVTCQATRQLILNVWDLVNSRGQKTLGNFSVGRMGFSSGDDGVTGKLKELEDRVKSMTIVLQSGGAVGPGGHLKPGFAAKGLNDEDPTPGRLWGVSGPGANRKTAGGVTRSGGRSKPFSYYSPIFVSYGTSSSLSGTIVFVQSA